MNVKEIVSGFMIAVLGLVGSGWLNTAEAQGEAEQSVRGGGVKVSVTLLDETDRSARFRISLDTHSVNLNVYRFDEIVRLRDGQGGKLAPKAVENIEGSGHHRKATLRFAWPAPKPQTIELVVKNVAGVHERLFRWMVK